MKFFFIPVIVVFLSFNIGLAKALPVLFPSDSYKEKTNADSNHRPIKYGIGLNLIPLSVFSVNPYFEYFQKNSNCFSFASRYKPSLDLQILNNSYEYLVAEELAFNFDYKINLVKKNYQYYIAPGLFYKRRWFKEKWIGYADGTQYKSNQYLENMSLNVYGFRVILGLRAIMGSTYFDFYTGPGIRYNIWDYEYLEHYGGSSPINFDRYKHYEKFYLSYHFGINIGFLGFRK